MKCSSDPEAVGCLPRQVELMTGRAVFTEAYAFLPRGEMRDIVTGRHTAAGMPTILRGYSGGEYG